MKGDFGCSEARGLTQFRASSQLRVIFGSAAFRVCGSAHDGGPHSMVYGAGSNASL